MQAWENFLALQEAEIGPETVARWLRTLRILRFDAVNLYVEARDPFHAMWFEEHIRPKANTQFVNNNGRRIKIHISVRGKDVKSGKDRKKKVVDDATTGFSLKFDDLDPLFTLDKIVPTQENRLALSLVDELTGRKDGVCSKEDVSLGGFNPVYFYGPKGSGKTHLLMGITAALNAIGIKAIYTRAETFTEHVVTAIRAGAMGTFRQAYRHAEVLCIDDIEIFGKKKATQEEFFHTFNTLHTRGKQLILSANGTPQELIHMEPRLVSRFEWGISVPVFPLSGKALESLLTMRSDALRFPLSKSVKEYLLTTFQSSTRSLVQALDALVLRAHTGRSKGRGTTNQLTELAAKELLQDLEELEQQSLITPERIIKVVADGFAIPVEDILGKSQQREYVMARQIAQFLCRERLKMSYAQIGSVFERDHSTVMAGMQKLRKLLVDNQSEISARLHAISKKL